jgi:hypothetical protein
VPIKTIANNKTRLTFMFYVKEESNPKKEKRLDRVFPAIN